MTGDIRVDRMRIERLTNHQHGFSVRMALVAWATWSLAFVLTTTTVRSIVHRTKEAGGAMYGPLTLSILVGVSWSAIAWHRWIPLMGAIALMPHVLVTAAMAVRPPPVKRLRQVGQGLLVASAAAAGVLGAGLHRG